MLAPMVISHHRIVLMMKRTHMKDRRRDGSMADKLSTLIEKARSVKMSRKDWEEQRRSFAYGNTKIENDRITRQMIDQEAEALKRASS
jgi:hypothetical protein